MLTRSSISLLAFSALTGRFAFAQIGGNGLCADPASLGPDALEGGYSPVSDPNSDSDVVSAAQAAAIQYFNSDESDCYQSVIEACGNPSAEAFAQSVDVTAACSQVVAGTNYEVAFTATIPCSAANKAKLNGTDQLTQTFKATVFVPLPADNGGEGQETTVDSVELTDGTCTGVKSSPSPSPSPSLIGGNGLCADPGSLGPNAMVGAYSPANTDDAQVQEAAEAAAKKAWSNESSCFEEAIQICGATEESFVNSVDVTAACTQVVAGTNVKVAFKTEIPCSAENKQKLVNTSLSQSWEATVFIPLPSSGGNDEVQSVTETSGHCTSLPLAPAQTPPAPAPTPGTDSAVSLAASSAIFLLAGVAAMI